jgi:hypothetical protein
LTGSFRTNSKQPHSESETGLTPTRHTKYCSLTKQYYNGDDGGYRGYDQSTLPMSPVTYDPYDQMRPEELYPYDGQARPYLNRSFNKNAVLPAQEPRGAPDVRK